MVKKLLKIPLLKRLVPSLGIRILKLLKKNRGFFNINGLMMYLDFLDPIDRSIILNQSYENEEIKILENLIKKNSIKKFIDIGSNCGFYSFHFAIKKLKVLAFEPNAEAILKMKNTMLKNKILSKKISLFPFGISNQNSEMNMETIIKHGYIQTGGSGITKNLKKRKNYKIFKAKFRKGDEILKFNKENLAIKIDVEKHELFVLHGISKLIKSNNCVIQIEIFYKNFNSINSFLNDNGYFEIYVAKERSNYFYSNFNNK